MPGILVAYYSRTGSVESLAKALATELAADLEIVRPARSYAGVLGYLKGIFQNLAGSKPAICMRKDPSQYDLMVVGAPVWVGRLAAPMRTYLAQHGRETTTVAAFCVSGRGGAWPQFFADVERLAGRHLASTLSLAQRDVVCGDPKTLLTPMLMRLRPLAERRPESATTSSRGQVEERTSARSKRSP